MSDLNHLRTVTDLIIHRVFSGITHNITSNIYETDPPQANIQAVMNGRIYEIEIKAHDNPVTEILPENVIDLFTRKTITR